MAVIDEPCALSVVIASVDASNGFQECVESIRVAVGGLDAELLIVDSSADPIRRELLASSGATRIIQVGPGALVPELWARGILASRGRAVALTTVQCRVPPSWAAALLGGLEQCAAGAASSLDLALDATARDRAIFYLRYSDFLQYRGKRVTGVHAIPADNAVYDGAEARRYVESVTGGFWEVDFHRHVMPRLGLLGFVPGAEVSFSGSPPLRNLLTHRFRHGVHSGAWRARVGARPRWAIILAAPLVPLLVLARVARRVARDGHHREAFVTALGPFLMLAAAWAAGEAWGAARPRALGPGMVA
jgi:hypothetical protein